MPVQVQGRSLPNSLFSLGPRTWRQRLWSFTGNPPRTEGEPGSQSGASAAVEDIETDLFAARGDRCSGRNWLPGASEAPARTPLPRPLCQGLGRPLASADLGGLSVGPISCAFGFLFGKCCPWPISLWDSPTLSRKVFIVSG